MDLRSLKLSHWNLNEEEHQWIINLNWLCVCVCMHACMRTCTSWEGGEIGRRRGECLTSTLSTGEDKSTQKIKKCERLFPFASLPCRVFECVWPCKATCAASKMLLVFTGLPYESPQAALGEAGHFFWNVLCSNLARGVVITLMTVCCKVSEDFTYPPNRNWVSSCFVSFRMPCPMVLQSVSCAVLGHQPHCAGRKRLLGGCFMIGDPWSCAAWWSIFITKSIKLISNWVRKCLYFHFSLTV